MTRRSVLAAVSVAAAAITPGLGGLKTGTIEPSAPEGFDPARHGFGFYNWRVRDDPYPETPDEEGEKHWSESFNRPLSELPGGLVEKLSYHAREGLLNAVQTNGYCYGMVFLAQKYFEEPETIPGEFETASEITHPNAPRGIETTPILDEIIDYHAAQYTDFDAWLGRYALLDTSFIDYESQTDDLLAAVDAFGSAGITLLTDESVRSHQVLVYDYERSADGLTLIAYDPNYAADVYEGFTYTIDIDTTGETPVPQPVEYGVGYDQFVFNPYDREIHTRRDSSGSWADEPTNLYDRLFETTLFVASDFEEVVVLDPTGRPLSHTTGTDPLHYRYGAPEGIYTIAVTASEPGEYALDVYAGNRHREFVDETIEGSLAAGETRRYEIALDREGATLESGVSGALALGAIGGYTYYTRS